MKEIIKSKKYLLVISAFLFIVVFAIMQTPIYLLLLIIPIYFLFEKFKMKNIKVIIFVICLALILSLLVFIIGKLNIIDYVKLFFKNHFNLNEMVLHFVNQHYKPETASFINFALFYHKDANTMQFYHNLCDLNIIYLVSFSGLQVQLLFFIYSKIVKNKIILKILNISTVILLLLILNFTAAIIRIALYQIIRLIFYKLNKYNILAISFIFVCFLGLKNVVNYGIDMSFFCTLAAFILIDMKIKNKIIMMNFINLVLTLVCVPFVSYIDGKISFFSVLFGLFFQTYFSILFILLLFLFPMYFLSFAFDSIGYFTENMIQCFNNLNIFIVIKFSPAITSIYFICLTLFITYLYRLWPHTFQRKENC
ncbi:MAG: hypothetical protein LBH55_04170 [Mycoplasmataceae bacterium]|jgi:hypothetical protein|nr:hypothetical protein [Mycoplasmataceae bacterium]